MEESTMVKAVNTASPHPLAGEMVPLTLFDRATFDLFVPVTLVYPAPTPSNEALPRVLAVYPHMAGRLAVDQRGRRCIHVNNEGVLVLEADVSVELVNGSPASNMDALNPRLPSLPEDNIGAALVRIKLNRYKCGGLVMGLSYHHQLGDGQAIDAVMVTWARAVRQGRDFTAPLPFLDRGILTTVADDIRTPPPLFDHGSIEFKGAKVNGRPAVPTGTITNVKVGFTAEFISELKARVGTPCSTFQCLLAHLWKKTTQARNLNPEEFTQVRVAVNCRGRAQPPVSPDFFGNMVLWAFPRLQVRDVLSFTYGRVVYAIRQAVARVDAEYIRSFLDFGLMADAQGQGQELRATAPAAGTMCCPDLEVDSWLGFRLHQMDFGGGAPSAFLLPDIPVEGLMVFLPTLNAGVDVFIALAEDHVSAFRQMCHSLDNDGPCVSPL